MAFLDETGLTHLWGKITNKFLAKSNVANNLTTTSEGYALDARQGVALMNAISGSNMKLVPEILINTKSGLADADHAGIGEINKTYTFEHDCIFYFELDYPADGLNAYIDIYIADTKHEFTISKEVPRTVNYIAFIPAGTKVQIVQQTHAQQYYAGVLATVLYIE